MTIETSRLLIRPMETSDYDDLRVIMEDQDVMRAYEGPFSDEEVQAWLQQQQLRYRQDGFGLDAVILKKTGRLIGQCGLTIQRWNDREGIEVGYMFDKNYWHHGYATEAARACKDYAFIVLGAPEVYSIIRDTNTASHRVAERNGMVVVDRFVKHYRGVDMPHLVFGAQSPAGQVEDF